MGSGIWVWPGEWRRSSEGYSRHLFWKNQNAMLSNLDFIGGGRCSELFEEGVGIIMAVYCLHASTRAQFSLAGAFAYSILYYISRGLP